jgi:hypothetical protein
MIKDAIASIACDKSIIHLLATWVSDGIPSTPSEEFPRIGPRDTAFISRRKPDSRIKEKINKGSIVTLSRHSASFPGEVTGDGAFLCPIGVVACCC